MPADPKDRRSGAPLPFPAYETVLEQETRQAQEELGRPAMGLFLSGLIAGFGVSISGLVIAVILSHAGGAAPSLGVELLTAGAYALGFVLVIMGHTDLFTEYTTMAILPVLAGSATVGALARLWSLVFAANLAGAAGFAWLAVELGPALGVAEARAFAGVARDLVSFPWWVMVLSATLTGWLMGLLSWLLSASRDTTSQILFIGMVAGTIGLLGLHHSITGTAEVLAGVLAAPELALPAYARFLLWTTSGNVIGGVVFAVLIRFSVLIGGDRAGGRENGRGAEAGDRGEDEGRG